jgi:hypothetical protein
MADKRLLPKKNWRSPAKPAEPGADETYFPEASNYPAQFKNGSKADKEAPVPIHRNNHHSKAYTNSLKPRNNMR